MASKNSAYVVVFFTLNILFVTLNAQCGCNTIDITDPLPGVVDTSPIIPDSSEKCSIDTLRLGVCANVLSGLINVQLGHQPAQPCCTIIQGLVDLEASVCLCIALKANVLGFNLNVPISLNLLLNVCNRKLPLGFQCA